MISEKKAPDFASLWPAEILEAMGKLWEYGVRPVQYTHYWIEQADHQGLDFKWDDIED